MSKLTYSTVAQAIGEVAIWWSGIETMAQGLALRLAALNEPSLAEPNAIRQLNLILTNVDQRELFKIVKALAFHGSPKDIFPRLEPILNHIDHSLRNERNRFIHDSWFATGEVAQRTSRTTKIVNIQSRQKLLKIFDSVEFKNFEELDNLAKKLKGAYLDLESISEEISAAISARRENAQEHGE